MTSRPTSTADLAPRSDPVRSAGTGARRAGRGTVAASVARPGRAPVSQAGRPQATSIFLRVVAWDDPAAQAGMDALGPYVETFWLPLLGPSAVLLLRRLVAGLRSAPSGYLLDLGEAARALGLGGVGGRRSPFRRAIQRCTRYAIARHLGADVLAVRRRLVPLSERQVVRLPPSLQEQHRRWVAATGASGGSGSSPAGVGTAAGSPATADQVRRRARALALELAGTDPEGLHLEHLLVRHGVHPAMAFESATWAAGLRAADAAHHPPALPATCP